jgi:putative transposase
MQSLLGYQACIYPGWKLQKRLRTHRRSEDGAPPPGGSACWLYSCAVRDGCSRRIIGSAIDDRWAPTSSSPRWPWRSPSATRWPRRLSCTLTAALRTPAHNWRGSPVGKSDRSAGVSSSAWKAVVAESFWATVRVELYHRCLGPTRTTLSPPAATGSGESRSGAGVGPSACSAQPIYKNQTTQKITAA